MSKSNFVVQLLLRALLVGAVGLALFGTAQAQGRIGVTQATQNNPMGKPPGGLDRVLRVGTDVQANEIITTAADDRAHLVFLDGTTLTVGPSSQLTVDKFVYDPTTQKGELAVNATKGVFRVIGGRISKTSAITVTTPSATMGIRGGIMVFGVQASATTSIFVYGNSMTVTANGVTQTVTVPGLSVSTPAGGTPGTPTIAVQGDLAAALTALAGNSTAAAATVAAIQTLVANNLGNAVTLQALIQAIIIANTATAITSTTTTTNFTVQVIENPNVTTQSNQALASPN
jgi:hypothetical protein